MLNMIESAAFPSFPFLFFSPCDLLFSSLVGRNGRGGLLSRTEEILCRYINPAHKLLLSSLPRISFLFLYILLCALRQHTPDKC
ncbi:hypothetical protein BDV30DRAFT_67036 [Aspergillus minisclerotigenes]|uniref:Uncharacterized protein n=1 Tax=Aspergillus minisclerotigenes TaxID=656917 RepID=A0A5N6IKF4_9EURO|nr:hypothetical protein BDV30DRAFT_67036 [Aspergillus minisclerotigenes]